MPGLTKGVARVQEVAFSIGVGVSNYADAHEDCRSTRSFVLMYSRCRPRCYKPTLSLISDAEYIHA